MVGDRNVYVCLGWIGECVSIFEESLGERGEEIVVEIGRIIRR